MAGITEEREIVPPGIAPDWSSKPGWGKLVVTWSPNGDELEVWARLNVWGIARDRFDEVAAVLAPFGIAEDSRHSWSGGAHYNRDGERVWTYNGVFPDGLLAEWDEQAPAMAARLLRDSGLPEALYIRWGTPPRSGRSRNYATGELEGGISVYAAEWNPGTDCIEFAEDGALGGTGLGYVLSGRTDVYLLTGDEIGRGSDGEPLLTDVRVLSRLCYDHEHSGFRVVG